MILMYTLHQKLLQKKASLSVGIIGCVVIVLACLVMGASIHLAKMRSYQLEERALIGQLTIQMAWQIINEKSQNNITHVPFNVGTVLIKKEETHWVLTSKLLTGEVVTQTFLIASDVKQ